MTDDGVPVVPHDDGIYAYRKRLEFGSVGVEEFAIQILEAYRSKEQERIGQLKRPLIKVRDVPEDVIMEDLKRRAGDITFAPTELNQHSTKDEHLNANLLESFFLQSEPDYDSKKDAIKYHPAYCWKVALLNAFRVLELTRNESIKFPTGWTPINCNSESPNYASLLASAAYQMGYYYAKALAMPKAKAAIRGEAMSGGNSGNYSPLGEMVYSACEEIEKRHGGLPQRYASNLVMEILEERGQGSTKNSRWVVFVGKDEVAVDSNKLGKFIRQYKGRKK